MHLVLLLADYAKNSGIGIESHPRSDFESDSSSSEAYSSKNNRCINGIGQ